MKLQSIFLQVTAVLVASLCADASPAPIQRKHLALYLTAEKVFKCYKDAHNIAVLGNGGALDATIQKFIAQNPRPSSNSTVSNRKACLSLLKAMKSPVDSLIQTDQTVKTTCKGASYVIALNDLITYYTVLLNNAPVQRTTVRLNMAKLTSLAKVVAPNLALKNGKTGVTPVVMRNYKILEKLRFMAKDLFTTCS